MLARGWGGCLEHLPNSSLTVFTEITRCVKHDVIWRDSDLTIFVYEKVEILRIKGRDVRVVMITVIIDSITSASNLRYGVWC